jgi:hypothetical protein
MKFIIALLFSLSLTQAYAYPTQPNQNETPGSLCTLQDPDFAERRYPEQIIYCQRNVSSWTKTKIYEAYQIPKKCRSHYTIDHLVPLSIGGSNHKENLWPENKLVKATRPTLEDDTYLALKNGEITQQQAIEIILDEKLKDHSEAGTDNCH